MTSLCYKRDHQLLTLRLGEVEPDVCRHILSMLEINGSYDKFQLTFVFLYIIHQKFDLKRI